MLLTVVTVLFLISENWKPWERWYYFFKLKTVNAVFLSLENDDPKNLYFDSIKLRTLEAGFVYRTWKPWESFFNC